VGPDVGAAPQCPMHCACGMGWADSPRGRNELRPYIHFALSGQFIITNFRGMRYYINQHYITPLSILIVIQQSICYRKGPESPAPLGRG
jgi:hypothetical protein